jgi:hypothetical protein
MGPGWVPFKIVSDSSSLHSRWLLLLIIGKNPLKEKFHRKTGIYVELLLAMYQFCVAAVNNFSSFSLKLNQQWAIEKIYIFSNSSHLEWREDSGFLPIMEIRHILIKDHIQIFFSETAEPN